MGRVLGGPFRIIRLVSTYPQVRGQGDRPAAVSAVFVRVPYLCVTSQLRIGCQTSVSAFVAVKRSAGPKSTSCHSSGWSCTTRFVTSVLAVNDKPPRHRAAVVQEMRDS